MSDEAIDADEFAGAAIPTPHDPLDDGSPPPALQAALASVAEEGGAGDDVLQALASSRLLVPVVAVLDGVDVDSEGGHREKESSMATVIADSPQHGRALLAFTGIETMRKWRADARPVAVVGPLAARAALTEGVDALVVDIGGPIAFAVMGYELLLLASVARPQRGRAEDPVLRAALTRLLPDPLSSTFTLQPHAEQPPEQPPGHRHDGNEDAALILRLQSDPPFDDPRRMSELVGQIAHDRVVRQLCPEGLRVTFNDTRAPDGP